MVRFGDTEQVGDHEQRERARELADELARAVGDELVELTIGEPPHERLVLAQALRRDQAHEQRPMIGVHRAGRSVGSWSLNGNWSRYCVISAPMSPTRGTGNPGKGPVTELHDEKVAVSCNTAIASS